MLGNPHLANPGSAPEQYSSCKAAINSPGAYTYYNMDIDGYVTLSHNKQSNETRYTHVSLILTHHNNHGKQCSSCKTTIYSLRPYIIIEI